MTVHIYKIGQNNPVDKSFDSCRINDYPLAANTKGKISGKR